MDREILRNVPEDKRSYLRLDIDWDAFKVWAESHLIAKVVARFNELAEGYAVESGSDTSDTSDTSDDDDAQKSTQISMSTSPAAWAKWAAEQLTGKLAKDHQLRDYVLGEGSTATRNLLDKYEDARGRTSRQRKYLREALGNIAALKRPPAPPDDAPKAATKQRKNEYRDINNPAGGGSPPRKLSFTGNVVNPEAGWPWQKLTYAWTSTVKDLEGTEYVFYKIVGPQNGPNGKSHHTCEVFMRPSLSRAREADTDNMRTVASIVFDEQNERFVAKTAGGDPIAYNNPRPMPNYKLYGETLTIDKFQAKADDGYSSNWEAA